MASFFQLRSLAGKTGPALPEAAFGQLWAAYLELTRTQWLDPDEIERRQLAQVRRLLAHSIQNVAYYRDQLAGLAVNDVQSMAAFRRIPLLSRKTCQDAHANLTARALPPGTVAAGEDTTSGSSGVPVRVLKTNVAGLWWLAFFLRDLEWSGIDPTGTLAAIRHTGRKGPQLLPVLEGVRLPSWLPPLEQLIAMGPSQVMDLQQEPRRQLQWLRHIDPDYFLSHTSNLELLASLVLEDGGRLPRLRAIQAISETLTPEAQARIEAAFGVPVRNLYSCVEAGYLASPCPAGTGLHVHAENVLFEVLNDANQPCGPGETGRVILTVLHNFRKPFIRYESGDEVTLGPGRCPCGRGLPWLLGVQGKRRTLFHLPGRLKNSNALAPALSELGGHHQHQVVQKALDHVVLRVVPNKGWTAEHGPRLRQAVCDFFEFSVRVDVELHDRLELPPSGKLRSMVCEVVSEPT